ncbi:MAG: leucine-rich repeat domain-containing protein [Muribaculaceae bacterium]|nr:leucine-rich repeat domain-containing protein [Muribaculaceae bacterium]
MKKFFLISIFFSLWLAVSATTITVKPGELASLLAKNKPDATLVLKGEADARDLALLRDLSGVNILDLGSLSITAIETDNPLLNGRTVFSANHLPAYIFFDAPFSKVILPASLTAVEAGSFSGSALAEVSVPEGVTAIGDYTFYGCRNLKKITLPKTLLSIGRAAFASCPALESINLEASKVRSLPAESFAGDSALHSLSILNIDSIGSRAFARSGIERLDLPAGVEMQPFALADMNQLLILNAPSDIIFPEGALMNCTSLASVNCSPQSIPALFAANCGNLDTSTLLADASSVGKYAMAHSHSAKVVLGPGVSMIDDKAFKSMYHLNDIDASALGDKIPEVSDNAFEGRECGDIWLKVADDLEQLWGDHPVWGRFRIYTDISAVPEISADAAGSGIEVSISRGMLRISAPSAITAAALYDASGNLLLALPEGDTEASVSIGALPGGVAIVSVRTATDFKGVKVIL